MIQVRSITSSSADPNVYLIMRSIQGRITLVSAFANFLIVDTFVSALYRVLVLQLFLGAFYDENVCNDAYLMTFGSPPKDPSSCQDIFHYAKLAVMILCTMWTAAQGMTSITIRRYAQTMEHQIWLDHASIAKLNRRVSEKELV